MPGQRPLLLGHRGARAVASVAENTFVSFDLALQLGCDGFEFDVRLTADRRAVICHDSHFHDCEIATAGPHQLNQLPAFENVLARYGRRAFLDVELKVADLEDQVLAALQQHPPKRGFVISSFLAQVVRDLHTRHAAVPLGIISETRQQLAAWRELPVDCVIAHHKLVCHDLVEAVHAVNKRLFVWTVNHREDMLRLAAWGADAIISDKPELLVRTLGQSKG